jgi:hypothetical protein
MPVRVKKTRDDRSAKPHSANASSQNAVWRAQNLHCKIRVGVTRISSYFPSEPPAQAAVGN